MEEFKKNLKRATSNGNAEEITKVLQSPFQDDCIQEEKCSILGQGLYDSVTSGSCTTDIIKLFQSAGAEINYTDPLSQSVLLMLCRCSTSERSSDLVNYLVQNGADINHENINGQTDFLHLFSEGKLPNLVLVELMDRVSNIAEKDLRTGGTFLHLIPKCQEENKLLLIERLIEKGIPVNSTDNNGDTPLHIMAAVADVECTTCLIENGADVSSKNRLGETLFQYLASSTHLKGFLRLTDYFLEKGLDINAKDKGGKTVIHHTMMSKETTVGAIDELLKRKVTINIKDHRGRNEIYCAVEEVDLNYNQTDLDERAEIIKYLAEAGVSVNEQNVEGISPLHLATLKNDLEILVTLLDCGADVMQRSNTGATALHWACKHYNMLHVIIHHSLSGKHDLNVVDRFGSTALHWAVWFKSKSATQSLLQVGCDYTIKDNSGNTPGALAKKLNFAWYNSLVDGENFHKMECLTLQEPSLECSGADPLIACPHLRYMRKENGELHTEIYFDHLNFHKTSIQSCLQSSLTLKDMGFFYPLQDNQWVSEKFLQLFSLLAERLGSKYPLFACEIRLAGSMYEGTKVKLPDEFDYLFIFSHMSRFVHPIEADGFPENYVKIKLKSGIDNYSLEKYLTRDGYLDSQLFLQDFYRCVNEELKITLEEHGDFYLFILQKSLTEIWCSLSELNFLVFGQEAKLFHVSVDVVPTLLFEDWVPKNLRKLDPCMYENETLDHFPVIMKTPDRCHVKDFTLFYRISYSYLEQKIIKNIPYSVKKGYILLKIFSESGYLPKVVDHDHDRAVKNYITSYHLKTCLLHEWYDWAVGQGRKCITDSMETRDDCVSIKWARAILDRYRKSIEKRFLQSFFNPKKNLFGIEAMNDGMQEQDKFVQLVGILEHILNVATS